MNLEKLLEQKDFEMLTATQRAEVLMHLSKEEYAGMRRAHLLAKASFSDSGLSLKPKPEILQHLRKEMRSRRKVRGFGIQLMEKLNYQIPVYQAAAATLFIAFGLHFMNGGFENKPESLISPIIFADSTTSTSQGQFTQDEDTVKEDTMIRIDG